MARNYNVLILGASYGALLGSKLAACGHSVTLVCRSERAEIINRDGIRVRLPVRGLDDLVELDSRAASGTVRAALPTAIDAADFDLAILAMQEPHYAAPGVHQLMDRLADACIPSLSLMNMPPLAYLRRLPGLAPDILRPAYTEPAVWDRFDPGLFSLCSPDPQAFRPADAPANVLQVSLPTNFKASRFESSQHTMMLRDMQEGIEALRHEGPAGPVELPVKLKVHDSLFVPLAKWAMLLTGNYRCVTRRGPRSIRDAVHGDLEASRAIYERVNSLCIGLGALPDNLVPFDKYAKAAEGLVRPSSAARALYAGATAIERVDRLVALVARQGGEECPSAAETAELVDSILAANRRAAA